MELFAWYVSSLSVVFCVSLGVFVISVYKNNEDFNKLTWIVTPEASDRLIRNNVHMMELNCLSNKMCNDCI